MRYEMVEDRFVVEQTHEIINLEHALADAEMKLPEKFLVMSIVDKFPKSWETFGMTLKHQKGKLSLDDLMIAISIEEEHRNQTHKMPVEHHPRANLIVGKQKVNKAITGRTVSMGNSSTAEVHGIGSVDLKFPSGRVLSLKRVHHISTVRRNIISGSVIVREGYELAFKFNKVVIQQFEISGIEVNTIVKFRDVVFIEDVFPMKIGIPSSVSLDDSLASTSIFEHMEKMTNVGVNPSSTSLNHEELDEPKRSKRARVVKNFKSDFVTYNIEDDPITFKDAMASSEAKQWKEAVKSEMDSIVSNGTWKLVDLPPGCTTIGCKWIFKKKLKPDRSVDKFKARLVAKGFKQKEGIDYFDTYSPVVCLTTIRVLIALASVYSLPIHQMDMKTAFLYGELEEEIYMKQPEGFVAHALFKNESGISVTQLRYSQIIRSLQYLANGTRLDISFSVSKLARYTSCPDRTNWSALDRVLWYLKGIVSLAIHYGRFLAVLEGYSDASWIAKNSGSNGCSGYVFTLGGGAVSWKSAKQTLITRSTFEAELCALDTTGTEAEWLFGLLSQLPILSQPLPPIAVHCDSQTTIAKVRSRKYN
ncbi:UNVERIFIED_CONTAM: Retrovirus-related Pol polyprotein from transposon TNT 1-94 [Sesamum radiatum]|uniref:Retrovirus-related Pol polyprotein from transposon TNT 1-94 n=1 Tax=Sesamum radiatum TaxID=300843 RepID=A0AAW2R0E8_SESRA